MQQEIATKNTTSALSHEDQQLLMNNIKKTYEGKNSEEIKRAEQQINIMMSMNQKSILLFLFRLIKPPFQMQRNFRMACANLIKKQFYRIAQKKELEKETYIKQTYQTLSAVNYEDFSIKQVLNIGLQYIFNADDTSQYKNKWITHVVNQIFALVENPDGWTLQTLEVLHGLVLILISYLNSLIQPIDQINFVNEILNYLCLTASLCGQFARNNINQSVSIKLLYIVQQKIFEFFQLATQRLLQQQDQAIEQIQKFKSSEKLCNIMLQYLYMFCQGETIITKYSQLNVIKASIIQILYIMDSYESEINISIIQLLYTTFIYQSQNRRDQDDDDQSQRIIYKTICILASHLDKKNHYQFFLKNKMEIIFALLLYSRTTPEEQTYLFENPGKFVQISQQFSQCYATSPLIKVKAATFIRIFVNRIDEGLSNLVQLCTIFIAGSLAPHETDSQILVAAKQAFSKYQFWNLSQKQKLDISFMVLTAISPLVFKREDLKQIIISLIITNFNVISEVDDDLVRARLIRLVGYYTSSIYFAFIQKLMPYLKVYFLEGLCTFEKIMKNKTYLEVFPIMHLVYLGFIDLVSVTDTIFERLILENYEKVMKKNDQLYIKCLQKIFNYFVQSTQSMLQSSSKQHAILCLNYMQKMIRTQKSEKYLQVLGKYYCKMEELGIKIDLLVDNFVSIYQTLISKQTIVTKPVQQFVLNFSAPFRLFSYQNCSQYFLLLNKYILKSQSKDILQGIYHNLCDYLMQTQSEGFNFGILPPFSHCLGHIIISHANIKINEKFVQFLVHILTKKCKQETHLNVYKPWYLFIMLHFIYYKPSIIRQFLLANKIYYPFMIAYFTTKFSCKIQRKAGIMAAQQLLNFQLDANSRVQIIKYCIIQLNMQKERYQMKRPNIKKKKRNTKASHQSMGVENDEQTEQRYSEEQAIQDEESSKKDEDSVYFKGYKHPFDQICEFSMFKHRIQSLSAHCKEVNNQNIAGLTEVMRYEWHKNNVRRVLKISK